MGQPEIAFFLAIFGSKLQFLVHFEHLCYIIIGKSDQDRHKHSLSSVLATCDGAGHVVSAKSHDEDFQLAVRSSFFNIILLRNSDHNSCIVPSRPRH